MEPLAFLEKLRSEYIKTENSDLLFEDKEIEIGSTTYRLNSWQDFYGSDGLIVFELKRKEIMVTVSLCIGIRYSQKHGVSYLSSAQLWDIGIP